MILRLSQKLNAKIKAGPLAALPLDHNPFADWSANSFVADRTQYILLTNTKSLYSTVTYGKASSNDRTFIDRMLSNLREFLADDGQQFIYRRFIAPSSGTVTFAKALDRSVTGSMNDLINHAKAWLIEDDLSPYDVGFKLNDIPFSSLDYANPVQFSVQKDRGWKAHAQFVTGTASTSTAGGAFGIIEQAIAKTLNVFRRS